MELIICKDEQEVAEKAYAWCQQEVTGLRASSLFIPAGQTPEKLYQLWESRHPHFLEGLELLQIDEVVTGPKAGLFNSFFKQALPTYATQIRPVSADLKYADLAILGLGLNGHVGFHEPSLPADFYSGCVNLEKETCTRLQLSTPTWGVTYGLSAFKCCRAVLLMVTGTSKKKILKQFLEGRGNFPTLQLKEHQRFTVIVDQPAMAD